jgi:hypothetical protein
MEKDKVKVTIASSRFYGKYGVIKKVTPKQFKIMIWDTGETMYLRQTSVEVLNDDVLYDEGDGKHGNDGGEERKAKKVRGAKVPRVNEAINKMLESYEDGVTREEWEGIVDKIGKLFI